MQNIDAFPYNGYNNPRLITFTPQLPQPFDVKPNYKLTQPNIEPKNPNVKKNHNQYFKPGKPSKFTLLSNDANDVNDAKALSNNIIPLRISSGDLNLVDMSEQSVRAFGNINQAYSSVLSRFGATEEDNWSGLHRHSENQKR